MVDVAEVREERDRVGALLRALEPDAIALADAEPMWEAFDTIERHAANAKTLLARRVEEAGRWRQRGHRDAAEGMAKSAGTTRGAAKQQLDLSKKLDEHPATETAMRRGEISPAQAAIVATGADGNPDAEQRLLDKAMTSTVAELRQEAGRERAAADPDPEETERRIHAQRRARTWTDEEGRWHFNAMGTIRDGSHVTRLLERLVNEEFAKARHEGRREEREAYAFDTFIGVFRDSDQRPDDTTDEDDADTPATKKRRHRCPSYLSILRLDHEALLRGWIEGDERCEIAGLGPVPSPPPGSCWARASSSSSSPKAKTSPTSPTSAAGRPSPRRSPCCGNHRVAASRAAPARASSSTTATLGPDQTHQAR